MFKKMLPWLIIILTAITLIAIAAFVLWNFLAEEPDPEAKAIEAADSAVSEEKLTPLEIKELTVRIDDITTNLADIDYFVRISFAFQLETMETKDEFVNIQHLVESEIIRVLADTQPDEISGSAGLDQLSSRLMNLINPMLHEGKITRIDITSRIITQQ